jgi:hypothetical protein
MWHFTVLLVLVLVGVGPSLCRPHEALYKALGQELAEKSIMRRSPQACPNGQALDTSKKCSTKCTGKNQIFNAATQKCTRSNR